MNAMVPEEYPPPGGFYFLEDVFIDARGGGADPDNPIVLYNLRLERAPLEE